MFDDLRFDAVTSKLIPERIEASKHRAQRRWTLRTALVSCTGRTLASAFSVHCTFPAQSGKASASTSRSELKRNIFQTNRTSQQEPSPEIVRGELRQLRMSAEKTRAGCFDVSSPVNQILGRCRVSNGATELSRIDGSHTTSSAPSPRHWLSDGFPDARSILCIEPPFCSIRRPRRASTSTTSEG
jgi:hypothetical protein